MTNDRLQHLLDRAARSRGIPYDLRHDIVDQARQQLRSSTNGAPPRRADIVQAVDQVHRDWSGRLWTALEALSA